jgi:transposase
MRQVREVLRLKHVAGHSERRIAAAIGISRYTVAEYLRRATVVGITWPVPAELDDAALEARLFSPPFANHESPRPQPDWPRLHAELRRPGVTLLLLWEEYRAGQPEGYGYSRFCDLYRDWRAGISPTMRQTHVAGERLFVDFAGQTVPITDPLTGTMRPAQIFHHGVRVAGHVCSPLQHRHTTIPDHMPSAHRRYADWTPSRLRREAAQIGPATAALVELILHAKPHPEQGFRACLGILRLVRSYGTERVEAACQRGIDIGARTYGSVVSILRNNLDRAYRPQPAPDAPSVQHGNIRGGSYYH